MHTFEPVKDLERIKRPGQAAFASERKELLGRQAKAALEAVMAGTAMEGTAWAVEGTRRGAAKDNRLEEVDFVVGKWAEDSWE